MNYLKILCVLLRFKELKEENRVLRQELKHSKQSYATLHEAYTKLYGKICAVEQIVLDD